MKVSFVSSLAISVVTAIATFACATTYAGVTEHASEIKQCDLVLGAKIFSKCAACHPFDASGTHGVGPNLYAVIGRLSGSSDGFPYSEALQAFERRWTKSELNDFLRQPMAVIPGTTMAFGGITKPHQRAAIICYLANYN